MTMPIPKQYFTKLWIFQSAITICISFINHLLNLLISKSHLNNLFHHTFELCSFNNPIFIPVKHSKNLPKLRIIPFPEKLIHQVPKNPQLVRIHF